MIKCIKTFNDFYFLPTFKDLEYYRSQANIDRVSIKSKKMRFEYACAPVNWQHKSTITYRWGCARGRGSSWASWPRWRQCWSSRSRAACWTRHGSRVAARARTHCGACPRKPDAPTRRWSRWRRGTRAACAPRSTSCPGRRWARSLSSQMRNKWKATQIQSHLENNWIRLFFWRFFFRG